MALRSPKYQQVFRSIEEDILSGRYSPGEKLPSETALLEQFETSRITVVRALRELQHKGLIQRRAGSGTYVADITATKTNLLFGSLIPDLEDHEILARFAKGSLNTSNPISTHCYGETSLQVRRKKKLKPWSFAASLLARKFQASSSPLWT